MRLSDLHAHMTALDLGRRWPAPETLRALRYALSAALEHEDFVLDCLERDFAERREGGPRGLPPFFAVPERGARLALAYWEPGRVAGAHEHAAWTVTAVVHNELAVRTYDYAAARDEGRLVDKNLFAAPRGRAGQIDAPCIHSPYNPTSSWSVSIHVFSVEDRPELALPAPPAAPEWPEPLVDWMHAQAQQGRMRVNAAMLGGMRSCRAPALLASLYAAGDDATRRQAVRALSGLDPERAAAWTRELAATELTSRSTVERVWPGPPLHVQRAGAYVELAAQVGAFRVVLVRTEARAEPALGFVAEHAQLDVADIPGGLAADDRVALCQALVDGGVLRVAPQAAG